MLWVGVYNNMDPDKNGHLHFMRGGDRSRDVLYIVV